MKPECSLKRTDRKEKLTNYGLSSHLPCVDVRS